MSKGVNLG